MGWLGGKRARVMPSKDSEGRTIFARSPVLDLEVLTPTDAYYVIAQLNMPDPVHPDDFSFTIGGMVVLIDILLRKFGSFRAAQFVQ